MPSGAPHSSPLRPLAPTSPWDVITHGEQLLPPPQGPETPPFPLPHARSFPPHPSLLYIVLIYGMLATPAWYMCMAPGNMVKTIQYTCICVAVKIVLLGRRHKIDLYATCGSLSSTYNKMNGNRMYDRQSITSQYNRCDTEKQPTMYTIGASWTTSTNRIRVGKQYVVHLLVGLLPLT